MSKITGMKYLMATAAALVVVVLIAGTALAHARVVQGDYAFVLGWLDEPPVAGLKNAALVELSTTADNQPVTGAEATLTAQIAYGGKTRDLLLRPLAGSPGTYVGDFIPSRRGTYTLKLGGTVGSQPIDVSADIEEVGSSDNLAFPEPVNSDLQKAIDDLQSQLSTARLIGLTGLLVGLISLVLVVLLFSRQRK
jgi:hypothetical protein